MRDNDVLPYRILIFDDKVGIDSFGETAAAQLRRLEFEVEHVSDWDPAVKAVNDNHVDIAIVDLDLNIPRDGIDFLNLVRKKKQALPVILATGNPEYYDKPIRSYADALASGPVMFYLKNSEVDLVELVREASNRVDPVRRSLSLMSAGGLGGETFIVDDETYTVDELLVSSEKNDSLIKGLRESLQVLVMELSARKAKGRNL